MSIKNPTLRRRTKELTECANDARECQLLGYELKELGSLVASMAIHMGDLQRKIDSQAEHIKALNEKLNNSEKPNNYEPKICDFCRYYNSNIPCGSTPSACKKADKFAEEFVDGLKKLKPKDEPQKDCKKCQNYEKCKNNKWKCCVYQPIEGEPQTCEECEHWNDTEDGCADRHGCKTEPQTDCPWK